jgi:galactokinase
MSHFYGVMQGNRGETTRGGTKGSGIQATVAGWGGCITVVLTHNTETGQDEYEVRQAPWRGTGVYEVLATGVVGASKDET